MSDKDLFGNSISLSMRDVERHITEAANQSFLNGYKAGYDNCRKELGTWININDKLPNDMEIVAVLNNENDIHAAWRQEGNWYMFNPCCIYESRIRNVTYWYELAELPKENK